jgi:hypothetical protein
MGGEQELMRYTDTQIKDALLTAVDLLVQRDGYLLEHALYEPALTHRIAVYLEGRFDGYNVDCEYDQNKGGPKNLPKYGNARPDILVHRRGENHPTNLLAVEAKKVGNNYAEDLGKLRELMRRARSMVLDAIGPQGTEDAFKRATGLVAHICGTSPSQGRWLANKLIAAGADARDRPSI